MSELRQDPSTRDWVVIAPERGLRPHLVAQPPARAAGEPGCPFCAGHEAETPPEVWRVPPERTAPWQVRVVPNRFPMLAPDGTPRREVSADGFVRMPGTGRHEVIVESPDHSADLARADNPSVAAVLEAYRARYRALRAEGAGVILIFRNHGARAGTSIAHPHSQIVSAPVVPIQVRHRFDVAMQHYDDLGTCLYVDLLEREIHDGRRIVLETPEFVAFQPFAAVAPFETWIMPRVSQPAFGDVCDSALEGSGGRYSEMCLPAWQMYSTIRITTRSSRVPRLATRAANTSSGTCVLFPGWRRRPDSSSVQAWPLSPLCPRKQLS
jgi:UDPglucose--hexose-1-phosphate uridylyltransferase